MKSISRENISEALRLTRAGRLAQATALIGHTLRGTADGASRPVRVEDAPAGAMTVQRPATALPASANATALEPPRGTAQVPRVEPLHEVMEATAAVRKRSTFAKHTYAGPAGTRDFKLFVPAEYNGEPRPLLVMLHGCSQSVDDFAGGTRMNELAGARGWLVAYPIQTASANQAKCWNWFNRRDQQRDGGEPAIVVGIVAQIERDHAVDPKRIYVAGLSAGGAAAAVLGARYPDVFAAIGVHSGVACGAAHDMASAFAVMSGRAPVKAAAGLERGPFDAHKDMPTIVFHGDRDTTVHPSNGDEIAAATGAEHLRSTTEVGRVTGGHAYTRSRYADESGRIVLERWTVHGAGHAWSGGDATYSYADPAGPDASAAMMEFFLAHQR